MNATNIPCPICYHELQHEDTFGNIDHCLNAIGYPRSEWSRPRNPVKAGDIYYCQVCECHYHTFDKDPSIQLNNGYPC